MKKRFLTGLMAVIMMLSVSLMGIPVAAAQNYVWRLVEVVDYPNEEGWKQANTHESYHSDTFYSRGNYFVKTRYIGSGGYPSRLKDGKSLPTVHGEGVKLSCTISAPPETLVPEQDVSLTLTLSASENTQSFFAFSAGANVDFYSNPDTPPNLGSGTRFKNKDGYDYFGIGENPSPSYSNELNHGNYQTLRETITAKAPRISSEGQKIALRQKFVQGHYLATYYIYEARPASSATPDTPSSPPAAASHFINVNTTTARVGEDIIASFSSVDNSNAWIGFYKTNSTDSQYLGYAYLKALSGSYKVTAPKENGTYQFRLFGDNGYTNKLATSLTVTVSNHAPSVSISKSSVRPEETVVASYTGGPVSGQPWIGLYKTGNTDRQYISYEYLKGSSGSYTVKAPKELGQYEFRVFQDNAYTRIFTSQVFTVTSSPPSVPAPSPGTPSSGSSFSDLPSSHWGHDTIMEMVELGILSGYPDGTFKPNNAVSRAEFAAIMVRALELPSATPRTATFADMPSTHWAYGVVESAKDYLTGYRDSRTGQLTFQPGNVAVREDVAVAIVKAQGLGDARANLSLLNRFSDQGKISQSLREHVAIAVEQGYMQGTNIGFEPQKPLTRAEACALLSRIIKQSGIIEKITM